MELDDIFYVLKSILSFFNIREDPLWMYHDNERYRRHINGLKNTFGDKYLWG